MSRRALFVLLAWTPWQCWAAEELSRPESRFAVFSGAASEKHLLAIQLRLEEVQGFLVEELVAALEQKASQRLIPNEEVVRRYGRNFLPIPPVTERDPGAELETAPAESCPTRIASNVRERLSPDFFLVVWALSWPDLATAFAEQEFLVAAAALRREYRQPFLIQAFSAKDCSFIGRWTFGKAAWLPLDGEKDSRKFAQKVARKMVEGLRKPLGL